MLAMRHSQETTANESLQGVPARARESNRQWIARLGTSQGIILLGGSALAHFRIRVAQSHVRSDLLPSFWSLAGILEDDEFFASAPFDGQADASEVPRTNGVWSCRLDEYDDPVRFPNIAVLQFTDDVQPIFQNIDRVKSQRNVVDLPTLMLPWLGYIWSAGQAGNPLLAGYGLPSAAFVETVYRLAGIELTPGLSSSSSCPEAIWASAKWWHRFYQAQMGVGNEAHAIGHMPTGHFAIRQPAAAVVERTGSAARR
jgi:hypothetical protein